MTTKPMKAVLAAIKKAAPKLTADEREAVAKGVLLQMLDYDPRWKEVIHGDYFGENMR